VGVEARIRVGTETGIRSPTVVVPTAIDATATPIPRGRLVRVWPRMPVVVFAGRTRSVATTPTPTPAERADRLTESPPSAKLVFKVLELDAPLTQSAIAERSRLSKRTTRHALSKLTEADLVVEEVYPLDARKRVYTPRAVDGSDADPGESSEADGDSQSADAGVAVDD
jgi:DNA-binding transcriptional ArsR family regulator